MTSAAVSRSCPGPRVWLLFVAELSPTWVYDRERDEPANEFVAIACVGRGHDAWYWRGHYEHERGRYAPNWRTTAIR